MKFIKFFHYIITANKFWRIFELLNSFMAIKIVKIIISIIIIHFIYI